MLRHYRLCWPTLAAFVISMFFVSTLSAAEPALGTHPFDKELAKAKVSVAAMKKDIKDYSCTFTKRERVKGKLLDYEIMFLKVRHEPFSVYMYWLYPDGTKGQQVVYIEGRNNGKLIAQPVGIKGKLGPYHLDVNGALAMQGQRYPITGTGIMRLMQQLIEEGMRDRKHGECTVRYYKQAKVEDRVCTVTEVSHPKRPHFDYYMARIFVDDQWGFPIRFESYLWPEKSGGKPLLLEEYTYTKMKFNNGYTDADFVIRKE